jgi:hypothetical protein
MTDDQIRDMVMHAPKLARKLVVNIDLFARLKRSKDFVQLEVPQTYCGLEVRRDEMIPPNIIVFMDAHNHVVSVQKVEVD